MNNYIQTRVQPENPIQRFGVWVVTLALFLVFSRLQDYVYYLHLPAFLLTICLCVSFFIGGWYRALESPIGKYLTALTILFGIACVFSVWKGGSVALYVGVWLKSYGIYVVVASLLVSLSDVAMTVWISVIGIFCTALTATALGKVDQDRVSTQVSRFGDANDLAQILLIGICLSAGIFSRKQTGLVRRVTIFIMVVAMIVAMARTGSRGGFIGTLVMILVLFFQSSALGKVRICVACLVISLFALALLPRSLMNRYLAVLGDSSAQQELSGGAIDAVEGRKELLIKSVYVTAQHPLLGVGPGMFMEAEDTIAKGTGLLHGAWHETHNMYTQVSCEAGLPALFCFLAMYVYGFKNLNAVCRAGRQSLDPAVQDAAALAFWMRLALVALTATGFFLSTAYSPEPLILLAMTVALERAVRNKMATPLAPSLIPMPVRRGPASRQRGRLSPVAAQPVRAGK
jgi:hypothetical protein